MRVDKKKGLSLPISVLNTERGKGREREQPVSRFVEEHNDNSYFVVCILRLESFFVLGLYVTLND